MFCKKCGAETTDDSAFCPKCGQILNDTKQQLNSNEKVQGGMQLLVMIASIILIIVGAVSFIGTCS
ncbi:MAG: zinc-ribbon domain-containing protein [Prevotellaceae bacterium]|jgi:uncharacterized membrane protein YvbJ|nr:zinc-ribbon domain-containing protein [Prevotellaceae bacterium]